MTHLFWQEQETGLFLKFDANSVSVFTHSYQENVVSCNLTETERKLLVYVNSAPSQSMCVDICVCEDQVHLYYLYIKLKHTRRERSSEKV